MKQVFVGLALALVLLAPPRAHSLEAREAAAEAEAHAWLALVDAGRYDQSWSAAAALFKLHVSMASWSDLAAAARSPLGAVKSRTLQSATFKRALPGVPDGEYVIVQYLTVFENKASAVETVTPMKDPDGSWRVSGYYIR